MIFGPYTFPLLDAGMSLTNTILNTGLQGIRAKETYEKQIALGELSHKKRLEEQSEASWHRCREIAFSQKKAHKYRLIEQKKAHHNNLEVLDHKSEQDKRFRAVDHLLRIKETAFSNELQEYVGIRLRLIAHQHAKELEQIRSQKAVETAVINRRLVKDEENSPFLDSPKDAAECLKGIYKKNRKPLVLIAPFWDNTRTYRANDEGGFLDFRVAINTAWQKTQWFDGIIKCDGYLKRPLRWTDRDIDIISAGLADIPVILLHGMVQGGQRVHPTITIWNLLPGQGDSYLNLNLDSFDIPLLKPGETPKDQLEFENFVAHYLATVIGTLSDAHHLVLYGKRPSLPRYLPEDMDRLKLTAHQFCLYYDLLCNQEPDREHFYRLDQANMLQECNLLEEANKQIDNALKSWLFQKNRKFKPPAPVLLSELANKDDTSFFIELAETYRLVGSQQKAAEIDNLISALKARYESVRRKSPQVFKHYK